MQAETASNSGETVGEMIMHHVTNSSELAIPGTTVQLPSFPAFEVAGLTIDMSMSKVVVFMMIAALLLSGMALVIRRRVSLVPSGFANLIEALVLFIRDDIAVQTMGRHAAEKYTSYL